MRSNSASGLRVFLSVVVRGVIEVFTYTDNGDSLDGVFEADGLVFGVLGHFGYF